MDHIRAPGIPPELYLDRPKGWHLVLDTANSNGPNVLSGETVQFRPEQADDIRAFFDMVNLTHDWISSMVTDPLPAALPEDVNEQQGVLTRVTALGDNIRTVVKMHYIVRAMSHIYQAENGRLKDDVIGGILEPYSEEIDTTGISERDYTRSLLLNAMEHPETTSAHLAIIRADLQRRFAKQKLQVEAFAGKANFSDHTIMASPKTVDEIHSQIPRYIHSLLNPMQGMLGWAQQIIKKGALKYNSGAEIINSNCRMEENLCLGIHDFLENMNPSEFMLVSSITKIFEQSVLYYHPTLRDAGIRVNLHPVDDAVMYSAVICSEEIIQSLVSNVIENVLKSYRVRDQLDPTCNDPKDLTVYLSADSWGLEIAFQDSGIGMPERLVQRGSFLRGDTSWNHQEQSIQSEIPSMRSEAPYMGQMIDTEDAKTVTGTGYGMATIAEQVVMLHGLLRPERRKDGKRGGRIALYLPL